MTPAGVLATVGVILVATIVPSSASEPVSATGTGTSTHGTDGPNPIKFLMVGDSQARTLGQGLSIDAQRLGVQFENHGVDACDLDEGITTRPPIKVRADGVVGVPNVGCIDWQKTWGRLVDSERPAVVGLLVGRGELYSDLLHGKWVHVGDTAWDNHLLYALNLAVKVLSSRGAHVILFTTPYVSPIAGYNPNGVELPEDQPGRVDIYNSLVRKVAAEHKGTVSVYDLNKEFTVTKDIYTPTIDGFTVRTADGIHFTLAAGELAGREIFPLVVKLALGNTR
jgi:hypothetical protein